MGARDWASSDGARPAEKGPANRRRKLGRTPDRAVAKRLAGKTDRPPGVQSASGGRRMDGGRRGSNRNTGVPPWRRRGRGTSAPCGWCGGGCRRKSARRSPRGEGVAGLGGRSAQLRTRRPGRGIAPARNPDMHNSRLPNGRRRRFRYMVIRFHRRPQARSVCAEGQARTTPGFAPHQAGAATRAVLRDLRGGRDRGRCRQDVLERESGALPPKERVFETRGRQLVQKVVTPPLRGIVPGGHSRPSTSDSPGVLRFSDPRTVPAFQPFGWAPYFLLVLFLDPGGRANGFPRTARASRTQATPRAACWVSFSAILPPWAGTFRLVSSQAPLGQGCVRIRRCRARSTAPGWMNRTMAAQLNLSESGWINCPCS